jgi:hypothetical protein
VGERKKNPRKKFLKKERKNRKNDLKKVKKV